jgi:hypothetical protein
MGYLESNFIKNKFVDINLENFQSNTIINQFFKEMLFKGFEVKKVCKYSFFL